MKGRFAPSPTGRMHAGNVYAALLSWLSARGQGGTWLLRIEDLDPDRSRRQYADQLMSDLEWLGLTWDEGPYYQSQRHDRYQSALDRLTALGLTYPCYCTRADILATQAPHESDGRIVYRGTCRPPRLRPSAEATDASVPTLTSEYGPDGVSEPVHDAASPAQARRRPPALRIMVPRRDVKFTDLHYGPQSIALERHCGDFVLRRSDGAWAYQLAVVVDDAEMGVTEVVRGRDLLLSAAQQVYLYHLLGATVPTFGHLPLLLGPGGQRLCKRDRAMDLGQLRDRLSPQQVIGHIAHYAGLLPSPTPCRPADLIPLFDWNRIPTDDILTQASAFQ